MTYLLRRLAVVFVVSTCMFALVSCTTKTMRDAEYMVSKNKDRLERIEKKSTLPAPPVVVNKGFYENPIPVSLKQPPVWMKQQITLQAHNMPANVLISRILRDTDADIEFQPQVNRNVLISLDYSGSIKGALDQVAATTNTAYTFQGNQINWEAFVTKTFNISFMPGTSNYQVGQNAGLGAGQAAGVTGGGGGNGGSGTNSIVSITGDLGQQQYSNLKGNLSVWDDLTRTLNELKSSDGRVSVSESTTSVTVYDHPSNVQAMADYINQLNHDLSREVSIQVEVLEIDLNKNFAYGINWNLIQNWIGTQFALSAGTGQAAVISDAATQAAITQSNNPIALLTLGKADGSNLIINALAQQGKVSIVTQPRVVTMNNQMAEIRITRDTSYLQSVSTTTAVNAGNTTSLTPGIVTDGFSLYLLPKIQGDKIYLQLSSSLSVLTAINTVTNAPPGANVNSTNTTSGQASFQAIQVPTLAEKAFNQRTVVSSGSTLVITGFQQTRDEANRTQLFGVQALGGTGAERTNTQTIVLITPTILGKV